MRQHRDRPEGSSDLDQLGPAPGKVTRSERVQRKASGGTVARSVDEVVAGTAGSTGQALPEGAKVQFEQSLGADLSGVRVHTGGASADAAKDLGAKAFATGQDIHFGAGQYQPDDPFGMHLLAHEVAHTVQQGAGGGGGAQTKLEVSEPGDALEGEADRAADAMVRGEATQVSAGAPAASRKVHLFFDDLAGAVSSAVSGVASAVSSLMGGGENATGPAPAASGGGARPMLKVGSSGPDVADLQRRLGITADGSFGPATRAAVVAFQSRHGLTPDGIVGPMTWGALDGASGQAIGGGAAGAGNVAGGSVASGAGGGGAAATGGQAIGGGASGASNTAGGSVAAGSKDGAGAAMGQAQHGLVPGEDGAQAEGGSATRAAIVSAARSKLGKIFSNASGGVDETGEKTRAGWEDLWEIFSVAVPGFPQQIVKYLKYGKNSDASNPNGLPSWCGIFATWAVMTAGGNSDHWRSGNRVDNLKKLTNDPRPGDVGNFVKNNHYCIIAAVNGDSIETIDGNSFDGASGGDGAVATKTRSRGEFRAFFRQVDD